MVYIFAGNARIAATKATSMGIPPESHNVTLITPQRLDHFRGRIVYEHDQILWGDFPNGGREDCELALEMAKR